VLTLCLFRLISGRRSAVASSQQEFDVVRTVIENKYYRAEVAYVFADLSVLVSEHFDELSAECDAVILLDDAQTVALEHDIFKITKDKQMHASTKLFVTLTEDAQAVSDEHRERRVDWCIDNQFEFIHLDKSNPVEGARCRSSNAQVASVLLFFSLPRFFDDVQDGKSAKRRACRD
jgi:hypothetical protein